MTILNSGDPARAGVLYLDVEGGFGGSSRSLHFLVQHLDRARFAPVVVVRKDGPAVARYQEMGVPCRVIPALPSFRPGERKRLVAYGLYLWACRRLGAVHRELADLVREHGVRLVHVNHESLALSGGRLASDLALPWACHLRVQLLPGLFTGHVYRTINRDAAAMFFITDAVMTHCAAFLGHDFALDRAVVARNIAPDFDPGLEPLPELAAVQDALTVLSLSNFSPNRGVDRVVDVALELARRGRRDVVFFLYGKAAHGKLLGGENPYARNLVERVRAADLEDMVRFPGHTPQPERALAGADCLVKLTREANPWGRDMMEAMAAGLPVVTLGAWEGFVEHGINGYLELRFDPARVADFLLRLRDEPGLAQRMRQASRDKAARLFSGRANAELVERAYDGILSGRAVA